MLGKSLTNKASERFRWLTTHCCEWCSIFPSSSVSLSSYHIVLHSIVVDCLMKDTETWKTMTLASIGTIARKLNIGGQCGLFMDVFFSQTVSCPRIPQQYFNPESVGEPLCQLIQFLFQWLGWFESLVAAAFFWCHFVSAGTFLNKYCVKLRWKRGDQRDECQFWD